MHAPKTSTTTWRKPTFSRSNANCVEVASWRKSSRSGSNAQCVEVASWRKSSRSGANANCVEVTVAVPGAAVRDSKNQTGPTLAFPARTWSAFLSAITTGGLSS